MPGLRPFALAVVACALLSGCVQYDVGRLAGDETAGRNNDTLGRPSPASS